MKRTAIPIIFLSMLIMCSCVKTDTDESTNTNNGIVTFSTFSTDENPSDNNVDATAIERINIYENDNYQYVDAYLYDYSDSVNCNSGRINGQFNDIVFNTEIADYDPDMNLVAYQTVLSGFYSYPCTGWAHVDNLIIGDKTGFSFNITNGETNYLCENESILRISDGDSLVSVIRPIIMGLPVCGVFDIDRVIFNMTESGFIGQSFGYYSAVNNEQDTFVFNSEDYSGIFDEVEIDASLVSPEECVNGVIAQISNSMDSEVTVFYAEMDYVVIQNWNTRTNRGFEVSTTEQYTYTLYPVWTFYYITSDGVIDCVMCDAATGIGMEIDNTYFIPYLGI